MNSDTVLSPDASRRVWLLGPLRIEDADQPLTIPPGNATVLLCYLLLHPRTSFTREHLADLFWPEATSERGRRNLSDTLYRLRRALASDWFSSDGDRIGLRADLDLWLDVEAFERLCESQDTKALEQAADLYRGDLLPEVYDDWIVPRRVALQEKYLACLLQMGQAAEEAGQPRRALDYFRRLSSTDPFYEPAFRGQMRALVALGRAPDALKVYEQLGEHLDAEMGIEPAAATRSLAEQIAHEVALRAREERRRPAPFVGRTAERSRLLALLDQAWERAGGLAVVLGEAGMGKTRLLTELARAATWRGWQVVWGTGQDMALPPAYSPLTEALAAALPTPRVQQLAHTLSPYWLAAARPLLPAMGTVVELPAAEPERRQLPGALGRVLAALGKVTPHLLLLDDVHWADPEMWPLLDRAHSLLADTPVLVVLGGRTGELRGEEAAWQALTRWDQAGIPVMQLAGLGRDDLRSLTHDSVTDDELTRLVTASGGNPLLALTLLESGMTEGVTEPASLPAMFRRRIASVSDPAGLALQTAAVLGFRFAYPHWQEVSTEFRPSDLPSLAGELEQEGLLYLEDEGYRFTHDTLRASVYDDIPAERRQSLHRRVLAVLEQHRPEDSLALLYHATRGEEQDAVARYALRAGEEALPQLAFQAAADHFTLALESLPEDDLGRRYRAMRGRTRADQILGNRERQRRDTTQLVSLAEQLGDVQMQAEAASLKAHVFWMLGDQESAEDEARRGLALARESGTATQEAELLFTLARIDRNRGDYAQARTWMAKAHSLYGQIGDRAGEANALDKLANLTYEAGDYEEAAAKHTAAAEQFHELGDPLREARTLSGLALAVRAQGDHDRGRRIHEQALQIGVDMDDPELQWVQQVNLGNIGYELGDYDTATVWYEKGLAVIRRLQNPHAEAMVLYNLGEACRQQGRTTVARQHFARALDLNRQRGYQRGVAVNQHSLGLVWLDEGDVSKARETLTAARRIWQELDQRLKLMETEAALALVYLAEGNVDEAQAACESALSVLDESQRRTTGWRWVHFAAYQVLQATGATDRAMHHLQQAGTAVDDIAQTLPDDHRRFFLQNVSMNRDIMRAVFAHAERCPIRLVRTGVPLGRELTDDDYVTVTWTPVSPLDETIHNRVQRRRRVLQRLAREAAEQGASPTDDDLAQTLGVSRRTVLRDIAALEEEGVSIPTRGRS